jgi:hypothetical protein
VSQPAGFASLNLDGCSISLNIGNGVNTSGPVVVRLSNNSILANTGIGVNSTGQVQTFGNNRIKGNTTDTAGVISSVPVPVLQ